MYVFQQQFFSKNWFTYSLGGFTLVHTPSFQKFNDFDNFNWYYVMRLHLMHNLHIEREEENVEKNEKLQNCFQKKR